VITDSRTGPTRCFLVADTSVSSRTACTEPVRWHGSVRSAEGVAHRVFSCNEHAGGIEDRITVTKRMDLSNPGGVGR
jgi:hypothetical protein